VAQFLERVTLPDSGSGTFRNAALTRLSVIEGRAGLPRRSQSPSLTYGGHHAWIASGSLAKLFVDGRIGKCNLVCWNFRSFVRAGEF